jgi:hypothetical protein
MGPLPPLYRWRTVVIALLFCGAVGAWLAFSTAIPIVVTVGALLGGLAGILVAYALVHDFSHHQPRPVRVHRR